MYNGIPSEFWTGFAIGGILMGTLIFLILIMSFMSASKREQIRNTRILQMKNRIRPFQEFAAQCMEANDRENFDKALNNIYRIMAEYADNY